MTAPEHMKRKLLERVDKVIAADRRFFERHPSRRHRVRNASLTELKLQKAVTGTGFPEPAEGTAWHVAVRYVAPGTRLRAFILLNATGETDISEAEASFIWAEAKRRHPSVSAIECELSDLAKAVMAKRPSNDNRGATRE